MELNPWHSRAALLPSAANNPIAKSHERCLNYRWELITVSVKMSPFHQRGSGVVTRVQEAVDPRSLRIQTLLNPAVKIW